MKLLNLLSNCKILRDSAFGVLELDNLSLLFKPLQYFSTEIIQGVSFKYGPFLLQMVYGMCFKQ